LFIFHLPNDWSRIIFNFLTRFLEESDLVEKFKSNGTIISARIMTDNTGKSKGFGFVSFETPEDA